MRSIRYDMRNSRFLCLVVLWYAVLSGGPASGSGLVDPGMQELEIRPDSMLSLGDTAEGGGAAFPAWTYGMKVWPFDILYPETTREQIRRRLDRARAKGANTVIFYIEEEQMYRTFVDEAGFASILAKIGTLIDEAHLRNLRVICYLNGLEVMAHDACLLLPDGNCDCESSTVPTLYRNHPDWVQLDISGKPAVWTCIRNGWITRDMEDAWASPYSGFRDLFKRRIEALGKKRLDAIYIDQASLPGMQDLGNKWASSDSGFAAAFHARHGSSIPTQVDWGSVEWRKFIAFRHEALRDYLLDLANTARSVGVSAFFESSSNDTRDGTLLGNEPALSVTAGIAYSPEIEPEGDFRAAFRMAKFARDVRQDQPVLYLGWPEGEAAARKEFAIALCQSGNYYPTAGSSYPRGAFAFLDSIRISVLERRVPYHEMALVYSSRNKDWTFKDERGFNAYRDAFNAISQRHLPFRILPLETLTPDDLKQVGPIVLAGIESLSDAEHQLLSGHPVVLAGENGTRNEWFVPRPSPLQFPNIIPLDSLRSSMPFTLEAPAASLIETYTDRYDSQSYFLFVFSPTTGGDVVVKADSRMRARIYELDRHPRTITAATVTVPVDDFLLVIHIELE